MAQGTGLEGWTITLNNQTLGSFINQTNSSGVFSLSEIPWGIYQLNETPQAGWTQVTANQTIEINGTSLTLANQYFNNIQQLGNLSGFKVNGTGTGLEGWTITLQNLTLGSFINQTNSSGAFNFTDIPWGIYQLNETPQAGWTQVTAQPDDRNKRDIADPGEPELHKYTATREPERVQGKWQREPGLKGGQLPLIIRPLVVYQSDKSVVEPSVSRIFRGESTS